MFHIVKAAGLWTAWYPGRVVLGALPFDTIYRLGVQGGRLLGLLSAGKRVTMFDEWRRSLPSASVAALRGAVTDSFILYGVSELAVLLYPRIGPDFVRERVRVEGAEHLAAARAAGRGVILLQAHYGAFQMMLPLLGHAGYVIHQVSASAARWKELARTAIERRVLDLKARQEDALPVTHIPADGTMRPVFRALQGNGIVGITADGGAGRRAVTVDFLGRRANFQHGVGDLAVRTGAAVVPAFILSEPGYRYRIVMHPPLRTDPVFSDSDATVRVVMQAFADLLTEYVRRRPGHYGYTLCLRRRMAPRDAFPLFQDYP